MSERAKGRFGKLRTGFDKLSPNGGWKDLIQFIDAFNQPTLRREQWKKIR